MNKLTLTIVVSGDQYVMPTLSRRPGETTPQLVSRALRAAADFVDANQLGDFESITRAWS
jgi:hypothetical protein